MITIENITRKYGDKIAVKELSLNVRQGEFFAFLGPNGAGKTTTIKMIAGLLKPTSGNVSVCGFDLQSDYIQAKKKLAYVPEQPYLYDKLTGREFMSFVANIYEMDKKTAQKRAEEYVDIFNMSEYIDNLSETYSHGMKQKLIISAMLLHDPAVMLIDEPLVGLDPASSRLVKNILKTEASKGKTIFMSTHILSVAEETADTIGIIDKGQLVAKGSLEELRKRVERNGGLEELFFALTEHSGNDA